MRRGAPLRRRKPLRRSPMRRGARRSSYALRPRDADYMLAVKLLPCAVSVDPPDPARVTRCSGVVEADHAGERGLGRKADDRTCIPMCTGHHRERTDHAGSFRGLSRGQARTWRERAIDRTWPLAAGILEGWAAAEAGGAR